MSAGLIPVIKRRACLLAVPRCTARQPHCRRPVRAAGLSQEATPRSAGRRRHATSGLLHSAFNQLPVLDVCSPRQDVALARGDAPYVALNDFVKHANDGSAVRCDVQAPNARPSLDAVRVAEAGRQEQKLIWVAFKLTCAGTRNTIRPIARVRATCTDATSIRMRTVFRTHASASSADVTNSKADLLLFVQFRRIEQGQQFGYDHPATLMLISSPAHACHTAPSRRGGLLPPEQYGRHP